MIPPAWRAAEAAVIGVGESGLSVSRLLRREGLSVYASDFGTGPDVLRSAALLREAGVAVDTGRHALERIARCSVVVVSPGVPPQAPPLVAARRAGVPVVSEIEVALRVRPDLRYIAVTGTNGKTTTTALIGHLLRALGQEAVAAGNIGSALSQVALRPDAPDWVALELSSFQLHDTPSIRPAVAVVTNLAPDHLDRYANVDDYYADKALMLANAGPETTWVFNRDDSEVAALPRRLPGGATPTPGRIWEFSIRTDQADASFDRGTDMLLLQGQALLPRNELQLLGDHNVANALAASLAVVAADARHGSKEGRGRIAEGLRTFRALEHRLEVVGEYDGVMWINDSKATNVSSTLVALEGMTRPTVMLLGGRHKGEAYTGLAEALRRRGKGVIAFGEAADLITADLAGVVPVERLGSSFTEVMARARALAKPGDVVLLSPACSSYDMFVNYKERGAAFRRLAAQSDVGGRKS